VRKRCILAATVAVEITPRCGLSSSAWRNFETNSAEKVRIQLGSERAESVEITDLIPSGPSRQTGAPRRKVPRVFLNQGVAFNSMAEPGPFPKR